MAIKKQSKGPGPKQGKPKNGSRTDSAGMQYFGKQVAKAMNSQSAAPKKAASAPKKSTSSSTVSKKPDTAKKTSTINKRAPLMDVSVGKKGYRMSIDTTNMNKPDEQTYNYIMRDSTGKVTSKGNLASAGGGAGIGKYAARQLVNKYKGSK